MYRRLLYLSLMSSTLLRSQEQQPPDTVHAEPVRWTHSLVSAFSVAQQRYSDWSQGGEDALSYQVSFNGRSVFDDGPVTWSNSYKLAFGQTKLGAAEIRKTDDKIDLETVVSYKVSNYINPYIAATLKTQFALGYKYDNQGNRTPISKFLDPGSMTQSLGAGYQFIPQIRTRLGAALREVVTSEYFTYTDDPKTPEVERIKVEDGLESVTDVQWVIDSNVLLTSKLELFAAFRPWRKLIVRGDNTLTTKVGRLVTLVLNLQIINDRVINPRTQFKETMAIGISYTVF